jgi:hypothetical protein
VAAGLWRARPAGKKTLRRLRFGNGKGVAARVMGLPKNLHEWALWREMTQSICARIVCHYIYPRHCCTYFLYIKDGSKRPLSRYPRRHNFLGPNDQYSMTHDRSFSLRQPVHAGKKFGAAGCKPECLQPLSQKEG